MSLAVVVDDWALAAVPSLDADLARAGALVMRSFRGAPNPNIFLRHRGVAVVGGADRASLRVRIELATATVAAPVVAILPPRVVAAPELRGPGVVDVVPAAARGVAARILLMAEVPVVGRGRRTGPPAAGERSATAPRARAAPDASAPAGDEEVVAVASSTGGVWVLAALLKALPARGRAVLVAQHMDAEFVPFFSRWLEDVSGWRTVLVDAPLPCEAGAAYLAAGGRDLVLDGGVLRAPDARSHFVPSADRLLASAARRGARATGVVLSGMGADGAAGLAELARAGGLALCQSPATAVVASMPESALRATRGAVALPPDVLAAAIEAGRPSPRG